MVSLICELDVPRNLTTHPPSLSHSFTTQRSTPLPIQNAHLFPSLLPILLYVLLSLTPLTHIHSNWIPGPELRIPTRKQPAWQARPSGLAPVANSIPGIAAPASPASVSIIVADAYAITRKCFDFGGVKRHVDQPGMSIDWESTWELNTCMCPSVTARMRWRRTRAGEGEPLCRGSRVRR